MIKNGPRKFSAARFERIVSLDFFNDFLGAFAADVAAVVVDNVGYFIAKNASRFVLLQNDGVAFHKNFENVFIVLNVEYPAELLRDDNSP